MNYKLLVETAMLTGEIMLSGGAETYRIEDTMTRILKISNLQKAEAYVLPTGIFLTLADPSIDAITLIKRVDKRVTNMSNIYEANNVSRNLCCNKISIEEAYNILLPLTESDMYSDKAIFVCTMLTSLFFGLLLGGNVLNCIIAGVNGSLIAVIMLLTKKTKIPGIVKNLVASIVVAFCSMFFLHVIKLDLHLDLLIGGSVMPLLPGVAITNAIRDTLQGDYISGSGRAIEAFVSAAMTAAGIGIGMSFFFALGGMI